MSAFADDVRAESRHNGGQCGVVLTAAMIADAAVRDGFLASVADLSLTASAIERVLRNKHAVQLRQNVITRHRRGECACPRAVS